MSLGDMYAKAAKNMASAPAYRHDQNYDWHCPDHHVEWKGQLSSRCWIQGCRAIPVTKHKAIVAEAAGRIRADRGE